MDKKEHLAINWTDGMKISKKHFWENYYHMMEMMKNYHVVFHNGHNYGLLDSKNNNESIEFDITNDANNSIVVNLRYCNAITKTGYPILFSSELYGDNCPSAKLEKEEMALNASNEYYIIVTVAPYDSIPTGTPDPDLEPIHHPYVLPKISISVMAGSQINNSDSDTSYLIVGRLNSRNHSVELDSNYIPPVTQCQNSSILKGVCSKLSDSVLNIENHALQVYKRNKDNPKATTLAENTYALCNDLLNFCAEHSYYLQHMVKSDSPIKLVELFSGLAHRLSISLNLLPEIEKERLLRYFYEWTDVNPYQFVEVLSQVVNVNYKHIDIREAIDKIQQFVFLIENLFKRLGELEYIGLSKDNIVISEEYQPEQKTNKVAWDLLD